MESETRLPLLNYELFKNWALYSVLYYTIMIFNAHIIMFPAYCPPYIQTAFNSPPPMSTSILPVAHLHHERTKQHRRIQISNLSTHGAMIASYWIQQSHTQTQGTRINRDKARVYVSIRYHSSTETTICPSKRRGRSFNPTSYSPTLISTQSTNQTNSLGNTISNNGSRYRNKVKRETFERDRRFDV